MNEELAASNEDSSFPCEAGILHSSLNCHISEPRGGLQSQTGDGAARAAEGPEHGLFRGRVGFARQNQGVSGAGRMLMRGISTRCVSKPPRRAACMSFSAPAEGRTFDGDKRMYNFAFQAQRARLSGSKRASFRLKDKSRKKQMDYGFLQRHVQ